MFSLPKIQYVSFLIVFFIACSCFREQKKDKASLEITISDCRKGSSTQLFFQKVSVLKNNASFMELNFKAKPLLKIHDLKPATYTIIYESIFGNKEQQKVIVSESKNYSVTICSNVLDHAFTNYQTVIDHLSSGEFYTIDFESHGCFHHKTATMSIGRSSNNYLVSMGDTSKVLSEKEVDLIRFFEIEMHFFKEGGCTTEDIYTVNFKNKTTKFYDRSCNWDGWHFISKELFGVDYEY